MLAQFLLNCIAFFIKLAAWVVFAFLAVPFGIYVALNEFFPTFVREANFGFWALFSILTIITYVVFWKPILWIVSSLNFLSAGS
ncbi:hypothetical protein [Flavobacterium sp. 14A]|uniref:hypothetical protein n=1 Tax=Flavobacterium sp. 14A TaxID=2735896 RepID=UPI00156E785D|nr:hypothetical protein [Flavobacterium sp. 14A]NRT10868.1 putative membrane protein YdbT with pleckstrin-like domain [Flavobacterium sp. 14A]